MNLKKNGLIILIIGVIILGYGIFQFAGNQPKKFDKSESKMSIFGGPDDLGNMLENNSINLEREQNRKKATNIMVLGGIIVIIGGGFALSVRKK